MNSIVKREELGDVVVLHIRTTSVDAVSAGEIAAACNDMRPITVLNFSEVSFINSAGISALLKFVVAARKAGHKLFAMNVSLHHQKIFKMVEMSRFMPTIEEGDLASYR